MSSRIVVGNDSQAESYMDRFIGALGAIQAVGPQGSSVAVQPIVDFAKQVQMLRCDSGCSERARKRIAFMQKAMKNLSYTLVRFVNGIRQAPNNTMSAVFGTIVAGAQSGPISVFGPSSAPYMIEYFTCNNPRFIMTNLVVGNLEQVTSTQVPAAPTATGFTMSQWFGPKMHQWDYYPWSGIVFAQQTPIVMTVLNDSGVNDNCTVTVWCRANPCNQDWSGLLETTHKQYNQFFQLE